MHLSTDPAAPNTSRVQIFHKPQDDFYFFTFYLEIRTETKNVIIFSLEEVHIIIEDICLG